MLNQIRPGPLSAGAGAIPQAESQLRKNSPLLDAITEQASVVQQLHVAVSELLTRLGPVLRSADIVAKDPDKAPSVVMSAYVYEVRENTRNVMEVINLLAFATKELEV